MKIPVEVWELRLDSYTSEGVDGLGYMGDCQNYGPFLGPYYNTGPNRGPYLRDPKRDHNFDNPPYTA